MKTSVAIFCTLLLGSFILLASCKAKQEIEDPTRLEVDLLVEFKKGISPEQLTKELKQFDFGKYKLVNKTLNQYIYLVTLNGQSADELIKMAKAKDYVLSAQIAPSGDGPAENMPSGKSKKTSPIKG